MTVTYEEDVQRNGIVAVALNVGPNRLKISNDEANYIVATKRLLDAIPIYFASSHHCCCYHQEGFYDPFSTIYQYMMKRTCNFGTFLVHCESKLTWCVCIDQGSIASSSLSHADLLLFAKTTPTYKTHQLYNIGDPQKLLSTLQRYGIPTERLPISFSSNNNNNNCTILVDDHLQYIKQRRHQEEKELEQHSQQHRP